MKRWRWTLAGVLSWCLAASWGQAQEISVDGAFRSPDFSAEVAQPQARQLKQDYTSTPIALQITLPQVTSAEYAELTAQEENQPLQIGFGRDIPIAYQDDLAAQLQWVTLSDGSLVSALRVTSPGAQALRIAVYASLDAGAELRFFSLSDPTQHFGPFTQKDFSLQTPEPAGADESLLPDSPLWSPVIEGETVGVEIALPSSAALSTFSLYVDQVSHLISSIPQYESQHLGDIGDAQCSHTDVQCKDVDNQASATAKMLYTEDGSSFLCTGILLNDTDDNSFIPYFITAHHCISTQTVASTLVTYWDFERTACGGPAPTTVTQLTGGADLLMTNSSTDSSLLRFRNDPPSGRWYAGWSSGTLSHPTTVYGVHHPKGDLKKYSAGTTTEFITILVDGVQLVLGIDVSWSQGTIESGSSGSGLFDTDGRLRGVASSAPLDITCPTRTNYGRFDLFYPHISSYLQGNPPSDDHGNTRETATEVSTSSSTSGRIEPVGDADYFKIVLSQAARLTVETTGSTDTFGILENASGTQIAENDDGGVDLNFRIVQQVSAGTYFVQVSGYDSDIGDYTLVVSVVLLELRAVFEGPVAGTVSGVEVIRGWAFFTQPGLAIGRVELLIDGNVIGNIPCCSERADVQAAFPDFPSTNTLHSGWGLTYNWGILTAGSHTVQVKIYGQRSEPEWASAVRTVEVIRPGGFEFLDRFDLSAARVRRDGQEIVLDGVRIRDKASGQTRRISVRYRWFQGAQALGAVASQ